MPIWRHGKQSSPSLLASTMALLLLLASKDVDSIALLTIQSFFDGYRIVVLSLLSLLWASSV